MEGFAALSTGTLAAGAAFFGLVVGSFLNVVVYRLPRGESLLLPGSHCPGCDAPLAPWDNVPVLSYLWLRGRCRHCGVRISLRYPAVELTTGLLFGAMVLRHGAAPMTLVWLVFAAALLAAALIDLEHCIIPDEISLGGLVLALLAVPGAEVWAGSPFGAALVRSAAGAALGGGAFWLPARRSSRRSRAAGRASCSVPGCRVALRENPRER